MTTIDLECPHCKRVGSVPREKAHTRLVCRKCHMIFHMDAGGRAVPGEPIEDHATHTPHGKRSFPDATDSDPDAEPETRGALPLLLGVLGVLVVVLGVYLVGLLFWEPAASEPGVAPRAQAVAEALANDRVDVLKESALPGTTDDAVRFFREKRPILAQLSADTPGRALKVNIFIVETKEEKDQAQVMGYYLPDHGTARAEQIANAAGMGPANRPPTTFKFWWAKGPGGVWMLDGTKTVANNMR